MVRKIVTAMAVAAIMASGSAAQRGGGGGMGRGGGGGMGGFPSARASKADEIAKELKLNKEQKADLETIIAEARKQAQPLLPQLNDGRVAIIQAHLQNQPPDEAVKKLAAVDAQMLTIEANAFAKIVAKMDEKQKSKANTAKAFELISGMFQGGAGMGMGMGRGARGGR